MTKPNGRVTFVPHNNGKLENRVARSKAHHSKKRAKKDIVDETERVEFILDPTQNFYDGTGNRKKFSFKHAIYATFIAGLLAFAGSYTFETVTKDKKSTHIDHSNGDTSLPLNNTNGTGNGTANETGNISMPAPPVVAKEQVRIDYESLASAEEAEITELTKGMFVWDYDGSDEYIVLEDFNSNIFGSDHTLYKINLSTGEVSKITDGGWESSPRVHNDVVVFNDAPSDLYAKNLTLDDLVQLTNTNGVWEDILDHGDGKIVYEIIDRDAEKKYLFVLDKDGEHIIAKNITEKDKEIEYPGLASTTNGMGSFYAKILGNKVLFATKEKTKDNQTYEALKIYDLKTKAVKTVTNGQPGENLMNAQLGKDCIAYRIQDSKTICVKDILSNKTYEINITGSNKDVMSYSPFAAGRNIFFVARAPDDGQNYMIKFNIDEKSLAPIAAFKSDDAPIQLQLRNGSLYWMQVTKSNTNDYNSDVWGAKYTSSPPHNDKTYRERIEENIDELVDRINKTAPQH